MIDLGSANINNVEELFLLIFVTIWLWAPVVYISFIFCIIAFEEKIDLENIPNHEKIREIVETNREKKSDRNLLTSNERDFLNENWEEISARIGKNNIKYINRFYGGGKLNWANGFFGGFWLLYRGMLEEFVTFAISLLGGSFFILFFGELSFEIIIIIICLLFAMLGNYYYSKEKVVHPDIKLSFIIVNLLFPPMILVSWFMFMFGGGFPGFGID